MTADGRVLAQGRHRIMGPSERSDAFEAHRWVSALEQTVPHVAAHYEIDALVISGNGPTVVAVDASGSVLNRPLLWMDGRTRTVGDTRSFYLPKIAWFESESSVADRVRWYLPFPEYLLYRLTGEAVAVTPSDEFSAYIWDTEEIKRYAVDPNLLPPFASIGTIVGSVTREASEWIGLSVGTPVVAGGSDFLMSLVGTNTLVPGKTCDRAGTSEGNKPLCRQTSAIPRRQNVTSRYPRLLQRSWNSLLPPDCCSSGFAISAGRVVATTVK